LLNILLKYPNTELWRAKDGEEAIEFLGDGVTVDVILLSTDLPVTDGWEALYVIKDQDNWPSIPVIMMLTEQNFWDDALKAHTIGAEHYVSRPVKSFELTSILDELLKEKV
jgi:CheY-like chemotaxis protein